MKETDGGGGKGGAGGGSRPCPHLQPPSPASTATSSLCSWPGLGTRWQREVSVFHLTPSGASGSSLELEIRSPLLGVREIMRNHSEPRGWKTQSAQSDDIARPPASHRSQRHPNPGQTPQRLCLCLPVPCSSSSPDRTTLDPKLDYTGPGFLCLRAVSSAWNTSPFS